MLREVRTILRCGIGFKAKFMRQFFQNNILYEERRKFREFKQTEHT